MSNLGFNPDAFRAQADAGQKAMREQAANRKKAREARSGQRQSAIRRVLDKIGLRRSDRGNS